MKGLVGRRREGTAGDRDDDARRHDDRRVRRDCPGLAGHGPPSALQAALQRAGLSADAGVARVSAGQWLQDVTSSPAAAIEFMRPWVGDGLRHPARAGRRQQRQAEVRTAGRQARAAASCRRSNFIDDKTGKPVGIEQYIGRRPVAAFGNSDGDYEMLRWTHVAAQGRRLQRFGLIVHHTDAEREWAYDRHSHIGQLEQSPERSAKTAAGPSSI